MPSNTIESIVSAYVRLKNRRALEDMRELRRQLLGGLQAAPGINPRPALRHVEEDLRVIEQGLEQLHESGTYVRLIKADVKTAPAQP
ncbi:hypothetical protein [Bradyrhizobium sp. CCGUVB23]|uniref:hypothetical protein n=1 Tax=Bradyrhizobium sp. CCGUVB23 TaxID=2949630 RepID=UPI0020B35EAC|nr:hypothetical protein [Bradyrhizobium sp. CCGUVB23]MCP3459728.1 hypothetical protein [Bradyrhizobium sp. CCGUVB23]